LAKAEHELRSYGRALGAAASGALMFAAFVGSVIVALVQYKMSFWTILLRSGTIVSAGEVAAWRLKWLVVPAAIVALWSGRLLIRSIKNSSTRFGGLRLARAGFVVSVTVTVLIVTLIGITLPVRLERRRWANEAAINARGYALARALLEYRNLKGTVPAQEDLVKELSTLPDPDGSIAEALYNLDSTGYQASTLLAASTKSKSLVPRGGAIRNAATGADTVTDRGVSFTSYKLRLPGEDKILNTDDDVIIQDGLITPVSELSSSSSAKTRTP
jgi:hypothetical protein